MTTSMRGPQRPDYSDATREGGRLAYDASTATQLSHNGSKRVEFSSEAVVACLVGANSFEE